MFYSSLTLRTCANFVFSVKFIRVQCAPFSMSLIKQLCEIKPNTDPPGFHWKSLPRGQRHVSLRTLRSVLSAGLSLGGMAARRKPRGHCVTSSAFASTLCDKNDTASSSARQSLHNKPSATHRHPEARVFSFRFVPTNNRNPAAGSLTPTVSHRHGLQRNPNSLLPRSPKPPFSITF